MIYVLFTQLFDKELTDRIVNAEKKIFFTEKEKRGKELTLIGRTLLGYILEKHYGIKGFSYKYSENGKPYIENSDVFFSISHSGEMVTCCVSDREIGCDIQKIEEFNPKIPERFFTAKEAEIIKNHESKARVFTRIWTLKESILKKRGIGISGGLDTYCFADNCFSDAFTDYGCNFVSCSFCEYEFSVCSEEKYDFEDILLVDEEDFKKYIDGLN
ncbi:MAG: 4'-phosphopantetheinyl transferase superfamily protein [Clostridia bacterium]|nr:4'-phosphopantetheinyl transferase superfamily protein [Clostridia bacterium]